MLRNSYRHRRSGLTLIEMLAVLVLLAIIGGLVGPQIFRQLTRGQVDATKAQMSQIENSLQTFYLDCGFFPSTEQGLEALIEEPTSGRSCNNYDPAGYLERNSLPLDPWDNAFQYISPGENRPSSFDLFSMGPDGEAGTEDDITNWE